MEQEPESAGHTMGHHPGSNRRGERGRITRVALCVVVGVVGLWAPHIAEAHVAGPLCQGDFSTLGTVPGFHCHDGPVNGYENGYGELYSEMPAAGPLPGAYAGACAGGPNDDIGPRAGLGSWDNASCQGRQVRASERFRPTGSLELSTLDKGGNPALTFGVAQRQGDEKLARFSMVLPGAFRVASDQSIRAGEELGTLSYTFEVGPGCLVGGVGGTPQSLTATITERTRTDQEEAYGVEAVWVAAYPTMKVDLFVIRNGSGDWEISGTPPQYAVPPLGCPPSTLNVSIRQRSSITNTPVLLNPSRPGSYALQALLLGQYGSQATLTRQITITP